MSRQISPSTKALGFWSAVLATGFSITYDVGQLAEWFGWLGSKGGPESASTPLALVVLHTPSLFLGSSFLVLTVSIHQLSSAGRKLWSHAAVATLFAAGVFTGKGLERVIRRFLIANGLLLPFIALQIYFHWMIWIAALWVVTFPGSTWSLAILFRRAPIREIGSGPQADAAD